MRRLLSIPLFIVSGLLCIIFISTSCGKGGDSAPATPVEADLAVTTNPVVGSNNAPAPITNGQPLTVTITSSMPTGGVKIDVTAKLETGSADFFTGGSPSTSTAINNYTILNTPTGGAACVCTIKVTSLSKPANVWTNSFRYASK